MIGGGAVPQRNEWGGVDPAGTIPQTSAPTGQGCFNRVSPGTFDVKNCATAAGITYTVTLPAKCIQFKCGLIFDIHGMTMSAASEDGGTNMRVLGPQQGYIVVQPTASGGNPDGTGIQGTAWDFGSGSASRGVAEAVRTAAQAYKVDDRRIHVMGFSMGGSMTWWLRCNLGNFLGSVAPMSFSNTSGGRCPAIKTPTLYQMGGSQDTLSGDTSMSGGLSGTMQNMISAYNLGNGQVAAQGNGYTWHVYDANGMHFEALVHNYTTPVILHHCIFGAPKPGLLCSCDGTQPIKEGLNALDFFKAYPKKA